MSLRYGLHDGRAHSLEEIAECVGLTRVTVRRPPDGPDGPDVPADPGPSTHAD